MALFQPLSSDVLTLQIPQEGRFQADLDFLGLVTSSASNPEAMLHGTCLRSLALLSTVGILENHQQRFCEYFEAIHYSSLC